MLTLNKKEIIKTHNSMTFTVIKNILMGNNIKFEEITRSEISTINKLYSHEYIINVKGKDYARASQLVLATLA